MDHMQYTPCQFELVTNLKQMVLAIRWLLKNILFLLFAMNDAKASEGTTVMVSRSSIGIRIMSTFPFDNTVMVGN